MKTTYPSEPIKDYNEWRKFIASKGVSPEEQFESDFMKIWVKYKQSVIKSRTK